MLRRLRAPLIALVLLALVPATASAIVGGRTAAGDWPNMAGMEFKGPDDSSWSFRCGGSLIRQDVVLTAAHCVDADDRTGAPLSASSFRFLLGTKRRSSGGERLAAARIVEHPGYDGSGDVGSDVALVKLAGPSALGRTIRIAEPADAPRWEPGDPATVIGWGAESYGAATLPDDLREAQVPIVSDDRCASSYALTMPFDAATSVCAGNATGGEDSCQGDSGGPLMVQDAAGAWIQVGAVSYGVGCAFPTQYGVYAEAGGDALRGWIAQHADELAAEPSPGGAAPGAAGAPQGPAGSTSTGTATVARPRLVLPRRVRARTLRVVLRSTAPVRSIVVTLRRGGRTLAVGRRSSLRAVRGAVVLRRRRAVRAGRATLSVRAISRTGRRVTARRTVRLSR